MCNLEKLGQCPKTMVCSACNKKLCHHQHDHCQFDGHFCQDGIVFCVDCWDKAKHKSVNIDKS